MKKYFLIGIKGTGMCALATLLKDLGNEVIGSDQEEVYFTDQILESKQIKCYPFNKATMDNTYIYIIGLAFDSTNIDVKKVIDNKYEYYYYNEFIGSKLGLDIIGICGTHGKTTTTKFIVDMLERNVSYIIGDGSGGGNSKSDKLILEACEYKNHFLAYKPKLLFITNIELDHPDFFKDLDDVINSFQQMVNQSDMVIINGDDKNTNKLVIKNVIKIGQNDTNDIIFKIIKTDKKGTIVNLKIHNNTHVLIVPFHGIHLIYDYVMAYVGCLILGYTPSTNNITLPSRRMKEYVYGKAILIDDYGHHPTEIKAVYNSIKEKYPDKVINVIFQPHTYSRTLTLKKEFKEALMLFDNVWIAEVFPSQRESKDIFKQLKINKIFKSFRSFAPSILDLINQEKEEVWLFLGAGTVNKYIQQILAQN